MFVVSVLHWLFSSFPIFFWCLIYCWHNITCNVRSTACGTVTSGHSSSRSSSKNSGRMSLIPICWLRTSPLLDCARRYSTAINSPAISIHQGENDCFTCLPCHRIGLIIINSRFFLPVGFPGGINSGRRGFHKTLLLSAFTLDIRRMLYNLVLDVSVKESACADRFKFHLDTPSSMYICVCSALHLHPDETKNRITDYNKLQQYYVNIQ